eukprot:CAMPEP_0176227556 /NCGR_PEP_ID=MMETSP0121_2-20121125/22824_1 /TAXON_ID=160619 /ORGANISM="Kryptoperidinium foliaceum, Strain CCMP 1326" /LENGTH=90 /DNA_ID=CAMNT_0017566831 /DNA_START=339 /DNA_END=607 /DNA_ORIENTATION=-
MMQAGPHHQEKGDAWLCCLGAEPRGPSERRTATDVGSVAHARPDLCGRAALRSGQHGALAARSSPSQALGVGVRRDLRQSRQRSRAGLRV